MSVDRLIRELAESADPVRRLRPPAVRAGLWLLVALPAVALIVAVMSPRADLAAMLRDTRFLIEQGAALATAVLAALAAFTAVVPGRPRWLLLLPAAPLAAWLASLGRDCLGILVREGRDALVLGWEPVCIPAIAIVGLAPAAAMVAMLRRGAALMPGAAVALGALAAAAVGNFGLRLFHAQDASLMVLVWQLGTVLLLTALAGASGRLILTWRRTGAV